MRILEAVDTILGIVANAIATITAIAVSQDARPETRESKVGRGVANNPSIRNPSTPEYHRTP